MAIKSDTVPTEDTTAPVEAAPVIEVPVIEVPVIEAPVVEPVAVAPVIEAAPFVAEPVVVAPVANGPVLALKLGAPGEIIGEITSIPSGATCSIFRTDSIGIVSVYSPLYQSTTFTAASLTTGITYTFTATAKLSDGTNATSAPASISL